MVNQGEFILTGTGNDGFRHRYSVKKNEKFKVAFAEFMERLGFDKDKILDSFIVRGQDEDDEGIEYEIKIKDIFDICKHYKNDKFDVDVFYGKDRIIILIRSKTRKLFVEHFEKEADWIDLEEVEKIRENKKRKKQILSQKRW